MRSSRTLRYLALAALAPLSLIACSDDSESNGSTETTVASTVTAGGDTLPATGDAFPVTIEHIYGSTTIESKPERVATVAWANHEVPIALGIVPVGMSKVTWGDDDEDGVLPWVEEALAAMGAETPELFDETDGIDFEAVADTEPDVILASYSGITQEEYDTLSAIAPTIAYPDVAWGTSMNDMITMNSLALGLVAEGEALIADLDEQIATALGNHPELEGKKVLFSFVDPTDLSQIGFYTTHDTRPGFLASLGMPMPAIVEEESAASTEFYLQVSSEVADRFDDVDLIVTYGEADGAIIEQVKADPLLSQIPAVANGSFAILENSTPLAASANPSPLSIGWGIEEYFALLAAGMHTA